MPRSFSTSIQSEVAWRALFLAFTVPASRIAPPNSSSFSVSVVLPASGCEMIANVRRCATSRTRSGGNDGPAWSGPSARGRAQKRKPPAGSRQAASVQIIPRRPAAPPRGAKASARADRAGGVAGQERVDLDELRLDHRGVLGAHAQHQLLRGGQRFEPAVDVLVVHLRLHDAKRRRDLRAWPASTSIASTSRSLKWPLG